MSTNSILQCKNRREIASTADFLISKSNIIHWNWRVSTRGEHFNMHAACIKEGQGTSDYMKMGHEEPSQSDNISVAAALFPILKSQEVC